MSKERIELCRRYVRIYLMSHKWLLDGYKKEQITQQEVVDHILEGLPIFFKDMININKEEITPYDVRHVLAVL